MKTTEEKKAVKSKCRDCCYRLLVIPFLSSFLICSAFSEIGHAQGAPPITASGLNTQVSAPINLSGGAVQHNITGGTRPGGGANLFHSFGEFGVPTNNIANFLNDSGLPTNNILSRVTGGNPSNILGTIQTEGFGNANLFLMNPAGIVFGPNASLNVGGATHFTTADYLKLSDGVQFTALPSAQDALLSVAPVAAFGFLESNTASISVQESTLSVSQGQTLSLVGGDLIITGSTLNAPGGQIALASVASPGEILTGTLAQAPNINGQSLSSLGTIQVSEQSVIDVSGNGGGTVLIRGGQFVLDNSTISANVTGPGPTINGVESIGGGIDIQVHQNAEILTGSLLQTNVSGNSTPGVTYGATHIKADRIEIIGDPGFDFANGPFTVLQSNVASGSTGGNSGPITLEANSTYVQDFVDLHTITEGTGNGGNIIFRSTGNLELNGPLLETDSFGPGNAGNIELTSAHGNIDMPNGPFISSQNSDTGAVGHILVSAPEGDVSLSNFDSVLGQINTRNTVTEISGTGGIQITARDLTIEHSGIQIDNFTSAQPGDLNVNLTGTLTLIGPDFNTQLLTTTRREARSANLNISAHDILLTGERSLVATETFRDGDGGALNIFTQNLEVKNGAQIRASSRFNPFPTPGDAIITPSGAGGTINIKGLASPADSIVIDGAGSGVFTDAQGTGSAGSTTLTAKQLTITSGGRIEASTSAQGSGGTVNIMTDNTTISGMSSDGQTRSGIFSGTTGTDPGAGAGGTISLVANQNFTLSKGATVSAKSDGMGDAGNINITGHDTILIDKATVITEAAQASGGTIKLTANGMIKVVDSTISSSVQGDANTGGGDINLDPDFIILQNSQILAKAVAGKGGNIDLVASKAVLLDAQSTLDASSQTGISGSVTIESPIQVLSGTIVPLPSTPVNVATLYAARCVAGEGGHFSTFVDSKSDSVAPTPGTFLASPFLPVTDLSQQAMAHNKQAYASEVTLSGPEAAIRLAAYTPPVLFAQATGQSAPCP
ncbi:MAG TPA: hypothetical protein DD706_22545 [Nitrospiraceae bacterium]|nr:hypothetical protein [Nitrospiraceae bacterium]